MDSSTGIAWNSAGVNVVNAVMKMNAMIASMTAASHGSMRAMPSWPKIARITTIVWQTTAHSTGIETPVTEATRKSSAMPASIACTQLQPMRMITFAETGRRLPRVPKGPRVSAIVGRPVRVPILPIDTSTSAPMSVPTMISRMASP